MPVQADLKNAKFDSSQFQGLTRDQLLHMYHVMYLSRRLDDREIQLKRQNRTFFQISSAGHEAISAASGLVLRPGYDWTSPYYRDKALCLMLGITPAELLLTAVGAGNDVASGGRQMPSHWGSRPLNMVTRSAGTGVQYNQACGIAEATLYYEDHAQALKQAKRGPLGEFATHFSEEIVYTSGGEGSTSEGEFFEALNIACLKKLPLLISIQDNGYAISVPVEYQTAGHRISKVASGFPGLLIEECDGTDPLASYASMKRAADYCRARKGPALVHSHMVRIHAHSLSDDDKLYKSAALRERETHQDPIPRFALFLVRAGVVDEKELEAIETSVDAEVRDATDKALAAAGPEISSIFTNIYSPDVDPTSSRFETEPQFSGAPITMVDIIPATLSDEMKRDERIVVFGEDVADCSDEAELKEVKGKGGVFKATSGLQRAFGSDRVFNTPIAEASIVGRAFGMAVRGLKPIAEIQFFDYIWPAMMQLHNELPLIRWRSNGLFKAPAVIRVAIGGYVSGGAIYHSQCSEVMFTHIPGLRVVMPATALDACGMLRTAIRSDDPVMFLEHKHLYRQQYNRSPYPGPDFTIPFGRARTVREGTDLSIITYGALVHRSEVAADELARQGVSVEIIDLRSLSPYDWDAIAATVRKTNRVIVAYEDVRSWGFGAEIVARIADELFDELDAPVRRVAAQDVFVAYHPKLEDATLPQSGDLVAAVRELLAY